MPPFVVITTQRSGSGLLTSLLNSHPEITCYHELLLNDELESTYNFYNFWLAAIREDPANLAYHGCYRVTDRFLHRVFSENRGAHAVGFNIKYNQLQHVPWMLDRLAAMDVDVIHVIRWNLLKTHVSKALNAMQTQFERKAHGTQKLTTVQKQIDADTLMASLERSSQLIDTFRAQMAERFRCLEVCYEDLTAARQGEDKAATEPEQAIYEFLGIKDRSVSLGTQLRKTNPDNLKHVISNHDQVAAALAGSRWEYLLDHRASAHAASPRLPPGMPLNQFHELSNTLHAARSAADQGDLTSATAQLDALHERWPGEPTVLAALRGVRGATGAQARQAGEPHAP